LLKLLLFAGEVPQISTVSPFTSLRVCQREDTNTLPWSVVTEGPNKHENHTQKDQEMYK